jgi:hypothetical protein
MDNDDGFMEGAESDGSHVATDNEDEDELPMDMEPPESSTNERRDEDDFSYEVLTADKIVEFMVDCIKDVNAVVQVLMIKYLS